MIIDAVTPDHIAAARVLFTDYSEKIGVDLEFQGFSSEVESLPGEYSLPGGALLLAEKDGSFIGCVALRKLEPGICEMKRLYVAPSGRGEGVGLKLAEAIIVRACELDYAKMRLDTLKSMNEARELYTYLGFKAIKPYYHNPLPDAEFYEMDL